MSDYRGSGPGSDLSQIVNQQQETNRLLAAIQQQLVRWNATWAAGFVDTLNANLSISPAGTLRVTPLAQSQSNPADPTGIAFGSTVMMGLAGSITPAVTGKVQLILSGTYSNSGGAGDGCDIQLRHGTGAAPANGAAAAGTAVGPLKHYVVAAAADRQDFSLNVFIAGLSVGVAHWIDVTLAATTAGTANIFDVSVTAIELE